MVLDYLCNCLTYNILYISISAFIVTSVMSTINVYFLLNIFYTRCRGASLVINITGGPFGSDCRSRTMLPCCSGSIKTMLTEIFSFLATHADRNIQVFYFRLHDLLSFILYAQIIYFLEL